MQLKTAMAMTAVLMLAAPGWAGEAPTDPKMVVTAFYQAVNAKNYDSMAKYMITDFVDHTPYAGQAAGAYGVQHAFEEMYKSVPDLKIQVQQLVADGDTVVARISMVGTHKGTFMGLPASGKPFRMGGLDMIRVKNGKATERWGYLDLPGLQAQLGGAAAAPAPAPAKK